MAIKTDLEKAFDRLEWSFIRHTLHRFNFPTTWIELIMACITSSNFSILLNGERLSPFLPSKGIRQGNPLSPYIFMLCMEHVTWLILNEVSLRNWIGIKTTRNGLPFSHMFFANDLILFAKASKRNCTTIKNVLDSFCKLLGQKSTSQSPKFSSPLTPPPPLKKVWRMSSAYHLVLILGNTWECLSSPMKQIREPTISSLISFETSWHLGNQKPFPSQAASLSLSRSHQPFPPTSCKAPY